MRSTRGFFKRRLFVFGISIFASIALISTGFVAWVMSKNASAEDSGNVGTGLIVDGQLKVEELTLSNYVISFGPSIDDNSGRVRNDGDDIESLSMTVTAKISPVSYLGEVRVFFSVPQGVIDAIEAGYISCDARLTDAIMVGEVDSNTPGGYLITLTNEERRLEVYSLNINLSFTWGAKFGNMNPGYYFDADPSGIQVSDDDVVKELENFRATLYGYINEFNEDGSNREEIIEQHENDTLEFTLYVSATVN